MEPSRADFQFLPRRAITAMSLRISIKSSKNGTFRPIVKDYNKKEIVVGRHSSNDFVLDQEGVSDRHIRIRTVGEDKDNNKIYVTDLGSSAGVSVGDKKIKAYKEVEVSPEEELKIGDFTLATSIYSSSIKNGVKFFSKKKVQPVASETVTDKITASKKIEILKLKEDKAAPVKAQQAEVKPVEVKPSSGKTPAEALNKKTYTENKASSSNSGSSETTCIANVKTDKVLDFDFEATRLLKLSGRVLHHGKPVEGVKIDGGVHGTSTTGAGGVFSFIDITEDSPFEIAASKDGFVFSSEKCSGNLSEDSNVEFKAVQLLSISGIVKNKGKALAGVEIDSGKFGKTVTDENGKYVIENVPESTDVSIVAKKDGFVLKQIAKA